MEKEVKRKKLGSRKRNSIEKEYNNEESDQRTKMKEKAREKEQSVY